MGRAEMGNFKYQISAEGYGPTADAIYVRCHTLLVTYIKPHTVEAQEQQCGHAHCEG